VSGGASNALALGSVALLFFAMGCGGDDDASAPAPGETKPTLRFETDSYTLQPGEEKYLCFTMRLPADKETTVVEFAPEYGVGTHHILFAQTLAPESDSSFECPVLFKQTWIPMYLGGVHSDPLRLPEGAGVQLAKGQQLLIQLHLQNTQASPISAKTAMVMTLADPGAEVTPGGLFGLDNRKISIPPNTEDVKTEMSCQPKKEMDVYAVLGHMHKRGKELEFSRGEGAGAEVLYKAAWDFNSQPTVPVSFHFGAADTAHLQCTHSNTGNQMIGYGESSDDEMCAFVLYYTPYDGLAGCIAAPQP